MNPESLGVVLELQILNKASGLWPASSTEEGRRQRYLLYPAVTAARGLRCLLERGLLADLSLTHCRALRWRVLESRSPTCKEMAISVAPVLSMKTEMTSVMIPGISEHVSLFDPLMASTEVCGFVPMTLLYNKPPPWDHLGDGMK